MAGDSIATATARALARAAFAGVSLKSIMRKLI
jgi:hypothetical protein